MCVCVYVCMCVCVSMCVRAYPILLYEANAIYYQFLMQILIDLISDILSFSHTGCITKVKLPSLLYNFTWAGRGSFECIQLQKYFSLCEMQLASSKF